MTEKAKSIWLKLSSGSVGSRTFGLLNPLLRPLYHKIVAYRKLHPRRYNALSWTTKISFVIVLAVLTIASISYLASFSNPGGEKNKNQNYGQPGVVSLSLAADQSLSDVPALSAIKLEADKVFNAQPGFTSAITIEPQVDFEVIWHKESAFLEIKPLRRWEFRQNYTVTIPAGQYSDFEVLAPFRITFSTAAKSYSYANNLIWVDSVYNSKHEFRYYISDQKTTGLSLKVYQGTQEQVNTALDREVRSENKQYIDTSKMSPLKSWTTAFASGADEVIIDVPVTEKGIYILDVYDNENDRLTQNFIYLNSYGVAARSDGGQIILMAEDLKDGSVLKGVDVTFYDIDYEQGLIRLKSIRTDKELYTEKDAKLASYDLAMLSYQGEAGILALTYAVGEYEDYTYVSNYIGGDQQVVLYYDKPQHRPDELINFKAVIRKRVSGMYEIPKPGTKYVFTLEDYVSEAVPAYVLARSEAASDEFGTVAGAFDLRNNSKDDIFVKVKVNGSGVEDLYLQNYTKPQYITELTPLKKTIVPGENFTAAVKTRTYAGNPLSGGELSVSLYPRSYSQICGRSEEHTSELQSP
jgi:hypothetical protein